MTEHEAQEGVNRRHLFQTLAAGAAVSGVIGSPALAQPSPAAVLTVASAEDYALNPTRWGSAEVAALFPGFQHLDMRTSGAVIRLRHGGSGPPLLLLHGNPENHVAWHKIAPQPCQLQLPRHGGGHGRADGAAGLSPVLSRPLRSRRPHVVSDVPRSPG